MKKVRVNSTLTVTEEGLRELSGSLSGSETIGFSFLSSSQYPEWGIKRDEPGSVYDYISESRYNEKESGEELSTWVIVTPSSISVLPGDAFPIDEMPRDFIDYWQDYAIRQRLTIDEYVQTLKESGFTLEEE